MNAKEYEKFEKIYLKNYKNVFKKSNNQEKRKLRKEIDINLNLTEHQKEELWNKICK